MSIDIPPSFNWIFDVIAGSEWPQGDEDRLRALASEWDDLGTSIGDEGAGFDSVVAAVPESIGGTVGRNFFRFGRQLTGVEGDLAGLTRGQAEMLRGQALNVEYAKYSMLIQMAFTLADILWALADPFAAPLVPSFVAAGRLAVRRLAERYLGRAADYVLAASAGAVQEAAQDVLAQLIQVMQGNRKGINLESVLISAGMGGTAGVFAHGMHGLLHATLPELGELPTGVAVEAGTGVALGLVSLPMGGDAGQLGWAGLNAGLTSMGRHGAHRAGNALGGNKDHVPDVPRPPELPELVVNDLPAPGPASAIGGAGQDTSRVRETETAGLRDRTPRPRSAVTERVAAPDPRRIAMAIAARTHAGPPIIRTNPEEHAAAAHYHDGIRELARFLRIHEGEPELDRLAADHWAQFAAQHGIPVRLAGLPGGAATLDAAAPIVPANARTASEVSLVGPSKMPTAADVLPVGPANARAASDVSPVASDEVPTTSDSHAAEPIAAVPRADANPVPRPPALAHRAAATLADVPDGRPLRDAIARVAGLTARDRVAVDAAFSDENLRRDFGRSLDTGLVQTVRRHGMEIVVKAVDVEPLGNDTGSPAATDDAATTIASVTRHRQASYQNGRSRAGASPSEVRVPTPYGAYSGRLAGVFNDATRSYAASRTEHHTTELRGPAGVLAGRVRYQVTVRAAGKPDRTASASLDVDVVVPAATGAAPPDATTVEFAQFTGTAKIFDAVAERIGGFAVDDPAVGEFRDWLRSLSDHADELAAGRPVVQRFAFARTVFGRRSPFTRSTEVAVSISDLHHDSPSVLRTGADVGMIRTDLVDVTSEAGRAQTRTGGIGFLRLQPGVPMAGTGPTFAWSRSAKTTTTSSDHRTVETTAVDRLVARRTGPVTFQVRIDNGHTVAVDGTAALWFSRRDARNQVAGEASTSSSARARPVEESTVDHIAARFRIPDAYAHVAGPVVRRLAIDGIIRQSDVPLVAQRLGDFARSRARDVGNGADHIRFPLSAVRKGYPDLFLRGTLDRRRGLYVGPTNGTVRVKTSTGRGERFTSERGTEVGLGFGGYVDALPVLVWPDVIAKHISSHTESGTLTFGGGTSRQFESEALSRWSYLADVTVFVGKAAHTATELTKLTGVPVLVDAPNRPVVDSVDIVAMPSGVSTPAPALEPVWTTLGEHRDGGLPTRFEVESQAPIPGLALTASRLVAGGTAPRGLVGRLAYGRDPMPPDDPGPVPTALEEFTNGQARRANAARAILGVDMMTTGRHNTGGLMGARDGVVTLRLATRLSAPRVVGRDDGFVFSTHSRLSTDDNAADRRGTSVTAAVDWAFVKRPTPIILTGAVSEAVATIGRFTGDEQAHVADRTSRHRYVERAYLIQFDATHVLRASTDRTRSDLLGLNHRATRERARQIVVPDGIRLWVPASEIHAVGGLADADMSRLHSADAARYLTNRRTDTVGEVVGPGRPGLEAMAVPGDMAGEPGHDLGTVAPTDSTVVPRLLAGLRDVLDQHDGHPGLVTPGGVAVRALDAVVRAAVRGMRPDRVPARPYAGTLADTTGRIVDDIVTPLASVDGFGPALDQMLHGGWSILVPGTTAFGHVEKLVVLRAELGPGRPVDQIDDHGVTTSLRLRHNAGHKRQTGVDIEASAGGITLIGRPTSGDHIGSAGSAPAALGLADIRFDRTRGTVDATVLSSTTSTPAGPRTRLVHDLRVLVDSHPLATSGMYRSLFGKAIPPLRAPRISGVVSGAFDVPDAVHSLSAGPSEQSAVMPPRRVIGPLRGTADGSTALAVSTPRPFAAPALHTMVRDLLYSPRSASTPVTPVDARHAYDALHWTRLGAHLADALSPAGYRIPMSSGSVKRLEVRTDFPVRELVSALPDTSLSVSATGEAHRESTTEWGLGAMGSIDARGPEIGTAFFRPFVGGTTGVLPFAAGHGHGTHERAQRTPTTSVREPNGRRWLVKVIPDWQVRVIPGRTTARPAVRVARGRDTPIYLEVDDTGLSWLGLRPPPEVGDRTGGSDVVTKHPVDGLPNFDAGVVATHPEPTGGRHAATAPEASVSASTDAPVPASHHDGVDESPGIVARAPRPPWYLDVGAMGEITVTGVPAWSPATAADWAHRLIDTAPVGELRPAIEAELRGLLSINEPRVWQSLFARGRTAVIEGRVVWLRPSPGDLRHTPAPIDETAPQRYTVRFSSTTGGQTTERRRELAGTNMVAGIVNAAASDIAHVVGAPMVQLDSSATSREEEERTVVSGRRLMVSESDLFTAGLRVQVFVDGVRRPTSDIVVPRELVLGFPPSATAFHTPRAAHPGPPAPPLGWRGRPRRFPEVINAVNLTDVVAGLHSTLRTAGLPPRAIKKISDEALHWLDENIARTRSTWWLTGTDDTTAISAAGDLTSARFVGHLRIGAKLHSGRLLGVSEAVPVREDLAVATTRTAAEGRGGAAALGVGYILQTSVGPEHLAHARSRVSVPRVALRIRSGRGTDLGVAVEDHSHTVLTEEMDQARYHIRLVVTVEVVSATHPRIAPVVRVVDAELGVPWLDGLGARDFETRVFGGVMSGLARASIAGSPPPSVAEPTVRALPGLPGALPVRLLRRPAVLDMTPAQLARLPGPGPTTALLPEPTALASRRGLAVASAVALPGADAVREHLRWALLQHVPAARRHDVVLSAVERELGLWFGRPAMEADFGGVLSGVSRTVTVAGRRHRVSVRATLGSRVGSSRSSMTVNNRSRVADTVTARRRSGWRFELSVGGAARVHHGALAESQIGSVRGYGAFGRSRQDGFTNTTKSYRRTEIAGEVVRHEYGVVYELSVDDQTWWIDGRDDVLAQVSVPMEANPPDGVGVIGPPAEPGRVTTIGMDHWNTLPEGERFDFAAAGASGVYPSFHVMRSLPEIVAEAYRRLATSGGAGRAPSSGAASSDWRQWPQHLIDLARPSRLSALFAKLSDRSGWHFGLPGHDGWHYRAQIRMRIVGARRLSGERHVEVEHYLQSNPRFGTEVEREVLLGANLQGGPRLTVGDQRQGPFARAGVFAQLDVERSWTRGLGQTRGNLEITRVTYPARHGAVIYRATPEFLVTVTRFRSGGTRQQAHSGISVHDAVDVIVPAARVADVVTSDPVAVAGSALATVPARDHLTGTPHPGTSYVEHLDAHDVLPAIVARLESQGLIPRRDPSDASAAATDLVRTALATSFSSSALAAESTALFGTGLTRWFPVTGFTGSTRYLWVRVGVASVAPATFHRSRPDVRLTLRTEGHTERAAHITAGSDLTVRVTAVGRGGNGGSAGGQANVGYTSGTARTERSRSRTLDIHRANPIDTSEEFRHQLTFRVETGSTVEPPELLTATFRAATRLFLPEGRLGGRRITHHYDDGASPDQLIPGSARVLVPSFMTVTRPAGTPAEPVVRMAYGHQPTWRPVEMPPVLPDALVTGLHPWDVPAAAAVHRWARVVAENTVRPPDLTREDVWRVRGGDFMTLAGVRYDHDTSSGMLRPRIQQLLGHDYQLHVGDRPVTVGFRLVRARPIGPVDGTSFKLRRYRQEETEPLTEGTVDSGWTIGAGPQGERQWADFDEFDRANLEARSERVVRVMSAAGATEETNDQRVRNYRVYWFDVTVVVQPVGDPRRALHVLVPRGLLGMLPVDENGRLTDDLESALPELFTQVEDDD